MEKKNETALRFGCNAKYAIRKLDKTVTRVVKLLMLSNKRPAPAGGFTVTGPGASLSFFSKVERLLSGDDCNE